MIIRTINKLLKKRGYHITEYPEKHIRRRLKIIQNEKIDLILDVGANEGQYALNMRKIGYEREILSFEPLKEAYCKMKIWAALDPNWRIFNYAIGDTEGEETINVSCNSWSSSFLDAHPNLAQYAPSAEYKGSELVKVRTLDNVFNEFVRDEQKVMLKIDTQGYEGKILQSAQNVLNKIALIQIEMSLRTLYKEESLFIELSTYLYSKGFVLVSIEEGFTSKEGELIQVDGIFKNTEAHNV